MKLTDSHFGVRSAVLQFGTNGQPADTMGKAAGIPVPTGPVRSKLVVLTKNVGDCWM